MPTNRTPVIPFPRLVISEGVVNLWRRIQTIRRAGADEAWEDEGGRRREFLSATEQLSILLRIKPWEDDPHTAEAEEPPAWMKSDAERDGYARAHELYLLLRSRRYRSHNHRR